MRWELSFSRQNVSRTLPDLGLLDGVVAQKIIDAMHTSSEQLTRLGVRHVLVGGLAVGAYGYPRASKDVDFLVSEEAYLHHAGGIISVAPGVPISVGGVAVDPIPVPPSEAHLASALDGAVTSRGVPIAPLEQLVFMKLLSPRRKDAADVVELLKAGADPAPMRAYIEAHGSGLLEKLLAVVKEAADE